MAGGTLADTNYANKSLICIITVKVSLFIYVVNDWTISIVTSVGYVQVYRTKHRLCKCGSQIHNQTISWRYKVSELLLYVELSLERWP